MVITIATIITMVQYAVKYGPEAADAIVDIWTDAVGEPPSSEELAALKAALKTPANYLAEAREGTAEGAEG